MSRLPAIRPCLAIVVAAPWLAGCAGSALTDHDCMTRVMYFESNRSSPEGMLAVGTTVMNRLDSPRYPKSVCEVVGQAKQFAPGVLDKPMNPREAALSASMADKVLSGDRHPQMSSDAMFFHTAGRSFPYDNMHYVLVAGGNAFYEKRRGQNQGSMEAAENAAQARYTPRSPVAESSRQDRRAMPDAEPEAVEGTEPPADDALQPPEGNDRAADED